MIEYLQSLTTNEKPLRLKFTSGAYQQVQEITCETKFIES